jgi:hypothetical protein
MVQASRMKHEPLPSGVAAYFHEQRLMQAELMRREGMCGYWAGAGCDGDRF